MLNVQTLVVSELSQLGILVYFFIAVFSSNSHWMWVFMRWWVTWDPEVVFRAHKMVSLSQLLTFVWHYKSCKYKNPQECLWLTREEDPLLLSHNIRKVVNKGLMYGWFKRHIQSMPSHFVPRRDLRYLDNLNIQDQFTNWLSNFLLGSIENLFGKIFQSHSHRQQ